MNLKNRLDRLKNLISYLEKNESLKLDSLQGSERKTDNLTNTEITNSFDSISKWLHENRRRKLNPDIIEDFSKCIDQNSWFGHNIIRFLRQIPSLYYGVCTGNDIMVLSGGAGDQKKELLKNLLPNSLKDYFYESKNCSMDCVKGNLIHNLITSVDVRHDDIDHHLYRLSGLSKLSSLRIIPPDQNYHKWFCKTSLIVLECENDEMFRFKGFNNLLRVYLGETVDMPSFHEIDKDQLLLEIFREFENNNNLI